MSDLPDGIDANELNAYARAKYDPTPDAVADLSKSEALFWVLNELTGDAPEGHPNDHNGNVTRSQIKAIADSVAAERYGEDN